MRSQFSTWIKELQATICTALEQADGIAKFMDDEWTRPSGGGGLTKIIQRGKVIEKGGVNISEIEGELTAAIKEQLKVEGSRFFACGISLVIHPLSPMVPTVHTNFRYFEVYDEEGKVMDSWFGGGADLTPYYLFDEDAKHFHQCFKDCCDKFDSTCYPQFKKQCDNYFVNFHRNNERRGVGGIFYDYMKPNTQHNADELFQFAQANGEAFIKAYLPIIEKRKGLNYTEEQKYWQLVRRGRYVEFNLIHDRGTLFGLKSNGRTESILMSLPPQVNFEYNYQPQPNTEEDRLLQILLQPVDWV